MDDGSRVHQGKLRGDVVAGFGLIDGELCCRYAVHLALPLASSFMTDDLASIRNSPPAGTVHLNLSVPHPDLLRRLAISRDAALILSDS